MPDHLKTKEELESGVSNFLQMSVQGATVCPNCGKKIQSLANIKMTKCPFCKTALDAGE